MGQHPLSEHDRESAPQESDPMEVLETLSDESYTGVNRCWPCTVLNLGLVGLLALFLRARKRSLLSLLVAVVGVAVVYLRGYLVPYTPEFAPRLVAISPVPDEWFHGESAHDAATQEAMAHEERDSLAEDVELDGETILRELSAAGVIELEGERLFPEASVDTAWHDRMDELARNHSTVSRQHCRRRWSRSGTRSRTSTTRSGSCSVPSTNVLRRPVVVAELAAYEVLGERLDDEGLRIAGAEAFRMFLDSCPVCGSELVESSSVSCSGGHLGPRQDPDETLVVRPASSDSTPLTGRQLTDTRGRTVLSLLALGFDPEEGELYRQSDNRQLQDSFGLAVNHAAWQTVGVGRVGLVGNDADRTAVSHSPG